MNKKKSPRRKGGLATESHSFSVSDTAAKTQSFKTKRIFQSLSVIVAFAMVFGVFAPSVNAIAAIELSASSGNCNPTTANFTTGQTVYVKGSDFANGATPSIVVTGLVNSSDNGVSFPAVTVTPSVGNNGKFCMAVYAVQAGDSGDYEVKVNGTLTTSFTVSSVPPVIILPPMFPPVINPPAHTPVAVCHKEGNGTYNKIIIDDNGLAGHDNHKNDIIIYSDDANQNCPAAVAQTAKLTVVKVVVNSAVAVTAFPLYVDNTVVASGVANDFNLGVHVVTEDTMPNFTASFSGACDSTGTVTLALNDNVTCTVTNTYTAPVFPATVKVTINKFVEGQMATAATANNAAFPMLSCWTQACAPNAAYNLDASGFNSNGVAYQAVTSDMAVGSTYTTSEVTTGAVVGATCADNKPFALIGYTTGDTLAQAAAAVPTMAVPSFSNLTADKFIIVWNDDCAIAPASIDLEIEKSVNNASPSAGNQLTYTLRIENNGANNATNVVVTDILPAGLTYSTDDGAATTAFDVNTKTLTWTVGNLAAGASAILTITAEIDSNTVGQTIANTAIVSGAETDTDPANNTDTVNITVIAPSGGGSANNGGSSSGGGPTPVPPTTGIVLGDTTTIPSNVEPSVPAATQTLPNPRVLGEKTELPRTGFSAWTLVYLGLVFSPVLVLFAARVREE